MDFVIELVGEMRYRLRKAGWRGVLAWFMAGHGLRLIPTALLLWAIGSFIYALALAYGS